MSRPHIITASLSRHHLAAHAIKAPPKRIYAFDPISRPLYRVSPGLLGSLSAGSNLRTQMEAWPAQQFFCSAKPTAPSEGIQLSLAVEEFATAGVEMRWWAEGGAGGTGEEGNGVYHLLFLIIPRSLFHYLTSRRAAEDWGRWRSKIFL